MPLLHVTLGNQGIRKTAKLNPNTPFLLGRDPQKVNVTIKDVMISGIHCSFESDHEGRVFLTDLSSNGTFVNGEKWPKNSKQPLPSKPTVYLGKYPNESNGNSFLCKIEVEDSEPESTGSSTLLLIKSEYDILSKKHSDLERLYSETVLAKQNLEFQVDKLNRELLERDERINSRNRIIEEQNTAILNQKGAIQDLETEKDALKEDMVQGLEYFNTGIHRYFNKVAKLARIQKVHANNNHSNGIAELSGTDNEESSAVIGESPRFQQTQVDHFSMMDCSSTSPSRKMLFGSQFSGNISEEEDLNKRQRINDEDSSDDDIANILNIPL
jgi:pSer/pThr/pTyr-binding forkhead associated (FHA) protein